MPKSATSVSAYTPAACAARGVGAATKTSQPPAAMDAAQAYWWNSPRHRGRAGPPAAGPGAGPSTRRHAAGDQAAASQRDAPTKPVVAFLSRLVDVDRRRVSVHAARGADRRCERQPRLAGGLGGGWTEEPVAEAADALQVPGGISVWLDLGPQAAHQGLEAVGRGRVSVAPDSRDQRTVRQQASDIGGKLVQEPVLVRGERHPPPAQPQFPRALC